MPKVKSLKQRRRSRRAREISGSATLPDLLKIASPERRRDMLAAVHAAFDEIPDKVNDLTVSQWAEKKRSIPSALTSRPGPFRWSVTPYLREIADCLSESSDVREVVLMKGARVGYNVGIIENHMGYQIEMCPGPSMFVGANKEQAQTVTELRVDRMLETSGLMGRIFSQAGKRAGKKQGDSKGKKEYPGGFLLIGGPSGPFLRGTGIRYLYLDELDEWKLQIGGADKKKSVTANQGDPIALARRRTAEYENRKIVYGSTPLDESTSKIKKLFEEGDQCYYYIPCPKCGTMQVLRWRDLEREAEDQYRIKYETDEDGRLIFELNEEGKPITGTGHAWYECENKECRHRWRNADKEVFLEKGEWRPTAQPRTPHLRSFHISSLYSPVGMQSWEDIVLEWLKIDGDTTKLRSFTNTILGEVWKERGIAPSMAQAIQHREGYQPGTLPQTAQPLFLTLGADIQEDRIAYEVVAWGQDFESWSIEYNEVPANGKTDDINCDAWRGLEAVLRADHAGLPLWRALIDCRYNGSVVHEFVERFPDAVRAVMGYQEIRSEGAKFYCRLSETKPWTRKRVDLNTSEIKINFYNNLSRGNPEGGGPKEPLPGYCHFPNGGKYDHHYFNMLTAEDRVWKQGPRGGEFLEWEQHGRNEALDCRAYAMGCVYAMKGEREQEKADEDVLAKREPTEYTWLHFWSEAEHFMGA